MQLAVGVTCSIRTTDQKHSVHATSAAIGVDEIIFNGATDDVDDVGQAAAIVF